MAGTFFPCAEVRSQTKTVTVAFYNTENLFDTINSPGVFDEEFTPSGKRKWNAQKYRQKIGNIARVVAAINGNGADIIGLAEVENKNVLNDLVNALALNAKEYAYVRFPSSDRRGIGVALLYRPESFTVRSSKSIAPESGRREFLWVDGELYGRRIILVVCHLSSNLSRDEYRLAELTSLRRLADSAGILSTDVPMLVIGDFNENPDSRNIVDMLMPRPDAASSQHCLYNPFLPLFKQGVGTTAYRDRWSMFDYMLINDVLRNGSGQAGKPAVRLKEGSATVFRPAWLVQSSGKFNGYPKRSFSGVNFTGGFSDHFPVYLQLETAATAASGAHAH